MNPLKLQETTYLTNPFVFSPHPLTLTFTNTVTSTFTNTVTSTVTSTPAIIGLRRGKTTTTSIQASKPITCLLDRMNDRMNE
ncbi:MAG: hypothetical protein ACTSUE_12500 [Promethearchaeota archaeon]